MVLTEETLTASAFQSPAVPTNLYAGYEAWKGWDKPFAYSRQDAAYYKGEMRGVRVKGADLLEIGFGSGGFLAWARAEGAHVSGTEINPSSLMQASAFGIPTIDPNLECVASLHAGRFDTIVAFDVFEHFTVDEVRVRLAAAAIMLKPEGCLVLRFPNAQSPFGLAPQYGDPTHKCGLSRSACEQLMQGTALLVERYGGAFSIGGGGPLLGPARRMRRILRSLIGAVLNFVYTQSIPWDPVVVLVLRKGSAG